MSLYHLDEHVALFHGDCLDVLAGLADASVDAVVTDPPYELGFMGRAWDASGIAYSVDLWRHALRVLKPGGHLLAFGGTRTHHRLACAIEDAGFELRDSIAWLYGSGFPKSLDVSKAIDKAAGAEREVVGLNPRAAQQTPKDDATSLGRFAGTSPDPTAPATDDARRWAGWGTALKPAHEPIVVARKPPAGTVAANVLAHGTGGLNIDGCRVDASGRPLRVKLNGDNTAGTATYGAGLSPGSRAVGTTDAGRWPTNVVLDEAAAAELDEQSGTLTSGANPKQRGADGDRVAYGEFGGQGDANPRRGVDTGGASRFFPVFRYQAKAPSKERPKVDGVAHPTVKPLALMRWLVRLVTPPGGVVLDPFAGSGTTAQACRDEGLRCAVIEREPTYLPLILARLGIDEAAVTEESMVTWGGLHAGDVVAGADGREWTVTSVGGKQRWVAGGPVVDFKLRRPGPGEGQVVEVVTTQKLTEPAPLARRADHTDTAAAVDALLGAGLGPIEVLREDTMTDPFSNPATAPSRAGHKRPEPKFDQWQRYKLPHPETGVEQAWTRVSTVSRTLSDEYGLTQWKLRMAVAGVARRADLIAGAAAADPETDKQALDGIVRSALERAESSRGANLGSAVHKFTERLDAGESIAAMGVPEGLVKDIEAYAATLKAAGLTVVTDLAERVAVNIALNYAGRIDRVVRDRAGTYYILDLKTAKDLAYSWLEIGIQLGGYANATHMALADLSGYDPMPPVDKHKGLVLHLPIGKAAGQVYAVDIVKGWAAFQTAVRVREMRAAAKEMAWLYEPASGADAARLRIGRSTALAELGAAVEDAKRLGAWDTDTEAYALARYDLIRVMEAADRQAIAGLWDELHPVGRWTDDLAEVAGRRVAEMAGAAA